MSSMVQAAHAFVQRIGAIEVAAGDRASAQGVASPQQIAAALRYLIDAEGVTGQMIAADSGQHLA